MLESSSVGDQSGLKKRLDAVGRYVQAPLITIEEVRRFVCIQFARKLEQRIGGKDVSGVKRKDQVALPCVFQDGVIFARVRKDFEF